MVKVNPLSIIYCASSTCKFLIDIVFTYVTVTAIVFRSYEYGPCIGVTRLERWNRAEALGLNPPPEARLLVSLIRDPTHHDTCRLRRS